MQLPEKTPPGITNRLRFTVRDEEADRLLAQLSDDETRQKLPGFLYVFSRATYTHKPDDYIDGRSQIDFQFQGYKKRVADYQRNVFSHGEEVELRERVLRLQVNLGHEAAKRILMPPFYDPSENTHMDVLYRVPGIEPVDLEVVEELTSYMQAHHAHVYDELAIVTNASAFRPVFTRSRQRKNDILQQ